MKLESRNSLVLFFFEIVLAVLDPLHFHWNFRISLSVFVRKTWDFDGDCKESVDQSGWQEFHLFNWKKFHETTFTWTRSKTSWYCFIAYSNLLHSIAPSHFFNYKNWLQPAELISLFTLLGHYLLFHASSHPWQQIGVIWGILKMYCFLVSSQKVGCSWYETQPTYWG